MEEPKISKKLKIGKIADLRRKKLICSKKNLLFFAVKNMFVSVIFTYTDRILWQFVPHVVWLTWALMGSD